MALQPKGGFYSALKALNPLFTRPSFIWINGLTLGVLSAFGLYAMLTDKSYRFYLLFQKHYTGGPVYKSLFANFSLVMWCFTLAICLFCFGLTKSLKRRYDWFFLATAGVTAMLFLDEIQRLSLSLRLDLGTPKVLMYCLYAVVVVVYGWLFRHRIGRDTPFPLLIITAVLFVISAVADLFSKGHAVSEAQFAMLEDGTKLVGVMNLLLYCWLVGQQEIRRWVYAHSPESPYAPSSHYPEL